MSGNGVIDIGGKCKRCGISMLAVNKQFCGPCEEALKRELYMLTLFREIPERDKCGVIGMMEMVMKLNLKGLPYNVDINFSEPKSPDEESAKPADA